VSAFLNITSSNIIAARSSAIRSLPPIHSQKLMSGKRTSQSGRASPKPESPESSRPRKGQASFSQSTPLAGTNRHIACKACRERKVRCGGGQPACQGCVKRGQDCVYAIPRDQDSANEEIAQTLKILTSRLGRLDSFHYVCSLGDAGLTCIARAEAEIAGQKAQSSSSSAATPNLSLGTAGMASAAVWGARLC
jgi:Fungal Zn(2)-Cys(6) binuclear cluster domain